MTRSFIIPALLIGVCLIPACLNTNKCPVPPHLEETYQKALNGDRQSQTIIGNYFYNEDTLPGHEQSACHWWRLAAEQNDAEAQTNLGRSYDYGYGVNRDYQQLEYWTRKAAQQGYGRAISNYGTLYKRRLIGTISDFNQDAYNCFNKAAQKGFTIAYWRLGQCYEQGIGVAANFETAAELYLKAAQSGCPNGQFAIGIMYYNGRGVRHNIDSAKYWWSRAAEQGYKIAENNVYALNYQRQQRQKKDTLEFRIISNDIYNDPDFNWEALRKAVLYNYKNGYGNGKQDHFAKQFEALFAGHIEQVLAASRYMRYESFHDKLMRELDVSSQYNSQDFECETFPGFKSVYYTTAYQQYIQAYYAGLNNREILSDNDIWQNYQTSIDGYMSLIKPQENPTKPHIITLINKLRSNERTLNKTAKRISAPNGKYKAFISSDISIDILEQILRGRSNLEGENIYLNGLCLMTGDSIKSLYYPLSDQSTWKLGSCITNLAWSLDSDIIYFTNGDQVISSYGVYAYDLNTQSIVAIASGILNRVIPDGEYRGYLEVTTSYYAKEGGCYWYKAAISPDGETEIKLSEPSLDMPED
ncbi:tetratricopeptide repeat protein [Alistipes sp.]|uniref:tetratricopeptide repeat protein n=1 Tax=Alistipes sp. TaxID=1872444 RepID=UPI00307D0790